MDVSSAGGGRGSDGCPLSSIVLPITLASNASRRASTSLSSRKRVGTGSSDGSFGVRAEQERSPATVVRATRILRGMKFVSLTVLSFFAIYTSIFLFFLSDILRYDI